VVKALLFCLVELPTLSGDDSSFKPKYNFRHFTLQDAVEFAKYAVEITAKTLYFYDEPSSVGGATDIFAILPDESRWLAKKELHG